MSTFQNRDYLVGIKVKLLGYILDELTDNINYNDSSKTLINSSSLNQFISKNHNESPYKPNKKVKFELEEIDKIQNENMGVGFLQIKSDKIKGKKIHLFLNMSCNRDQSNQRERENSYYDTKNQTICNFKTLSMCDKQDLKRNNRNISHVKDDKQTKSLVFQSSNISSENENIFNLIKKNLNLETNNFDQKKKFVHPVNLKYNGDKNHDLGKFNSCMQLSLIPNFGITNKNNPNFQTKKIENSIVQNFSLSNISHLDTSFCSENTTKKSKFLNQIDSESIKKNELCLKGYNYLKILANNLKKIEDVEMNKHKEDYKSFLENFKLIDLKSKDENGEKILINKKNNEFNPLLLSDKQFKEDKKRQLVIPNDKNTTQIIYNLKIKNNDKKNKFKIKKIIKMRARKNSNSNLYSNNREK